VRVQLTLWIGSSIKDIQKASCAVPGKEILQFQQ
jgi:hypothetical protein